MGSLVKGEAPRSGSVVEEFHAPRARESFQMESVMALVTQQNSELQREVIALRHGQAASEKKKEDTVCV